MSRSSALFLLFALWCAIYLPGLGSTELKGEEGRRIMPGVTMLETGNWLVPYVGGKPFLRKPPLVNWIIAASFRLTGVRNEWTARLPSVLAMLAMAATIILISGPGNWLQTETAFVAAVLSLTQLASFEKGRMAEIEAIYSALAGMATVLWLAWWTEKRSPWLIWTVPAVLLGIDALAKGPLHLLFFYGIAGCVLGCTGEWRQLRERRQALPLAVSLLVVGGIFYAWYLPYSHTQASEQTAAVWKGQFLGRLTGEFQLVPWLKQIPSGLLDHLPWLLLTPLWWRRELPQLGERSWSVFRGVRLAVSVSFLLLLALPGMLPRYTMPLLAPFSCLTALAVADERLAPASGALRAWWRANFALACAILAAALAAPAVVAWGDGHHLLSEPAYDPAGMAGTLYWPLLAAAGAMSVALVAILRRRSLARPSLIAATSAALIGAGTFLFAGAAVPFIRHAGNVRILGEAIDESIPVGETLYLYNPEYLQAVFYLAVPYRYAPDVSDVPPEARWVLARIEGYKHLLEQRPEFRVVRSLPDEKKTQVVLLERQP